MEPRILPHSARRLRDEPIDVASSVVEQFGNRGATMLGEAQVAAFLDGRLRRAGLKVSADGFQSSAGIVWDGVAVALIVLLGVVVYRWLPVVGLVIAAGGCFVSGWQLFWQVPGFLVKHGASQNIVGTRALVQRARCRVVLLAPLDAPKQLPSGFWKRYVDESIRIVRAGLCATAMCGALVGMFVGPLSLRLLCWYVQIFAVVLLVIAGCLDIWLGRAPVSPGAVNHAAAMAALLACAEELVSAEHIELWAVGIGASVTGEGLRDLLRRYPFERASTVFVALESLGRGELAYVTRSGGLVPQSSAPDLIEVAAEVERADPLINAAPRSVRFVPTMLGVLRRERWRAIGLMCLDEDGFPPAYASVDDLPAALDADVLDRAIRLALGLVRQIDKAYT